MHDFLGTAWVAGREALPVLTLPGASGARPLSASELGQTDGPHWASLSSVFLGEYWLQLRV